MNNNNRTTILHYIRKVYDFYFCIYMYIDILGLYSKRKAWKHLMVGLKYARYIKWKKELQENCGKWGRRRSCTHLPFVYGHNLIISWFKLYIMVRVGLTCFQLLNQCSRSCNSHWIAFKCIIYVILTQPMQVQLMVTTAWPFKRTSRHQTILCLVISWSILIWESVHRLSEKIISI